MLLIFVEFFMFFVVVIDGNGLISRIDWFMIGWIRNIWLFSVLCKLCIGRCIFLRYDINFKFFVGLKIVRMWMCCSEGIVKILGIVYY